VRSRFDGIVDERGEESSHCVHRTIPAALIVAMLSIAEEVWAGDQPALILPLRDALAIADQPATPSSSSHAAATPSAWQGAVTGGPPPPPGFIPKRIHIPNLYRVHCERDAPASPTGRQRRWSRSS
jgi:hypothetical protein